MKEVTHWQETEKQVKNSEKVETTYTATELCMLCLSGTDTIQGFHDLKQFVDIVSVTCCDRK